MKNSDINQFTKTVTFAHQFNLILIQHKKSGEDWEKIELNGQEDRTENITLAAV